jgi:ribonuclease HI
MPPTQRRKRPAPDGQLELTTTLEVAARRRVRVYSDGAARGNPGPAGAGAVVIDEAGTAVAEIGRYLGEQTNNVAEYEGLLLGLRHALVHGATDVEVLADSQLLIRQLAGVYRVKSPGLIPLFEEAKRLLKRFKNVELRHIPREMNGAADEMSNRAIDERMNE